MKYTFSFRAIIAFLAFALSATIPAVAAEPVPAADFIESDGVRRQIFDTWLDEELIQVMKLDTAQYTDRYEYSFVVAHERDKTGAFLAVTVTPGETAGIRGTWVLFRRVSDGMPDSIRIYPVNDPSVYVVIRPSSTNPERGRSLLDLVVMDTPTITSVPVGVPFISLYTASFASIVGMTRSTVPWRLIAPELYRYGDMEATVATVRNGLKTLVYLDDGAFNERGEPVLIETGLPQDPAQILSARTKSNTGSDVYGGVNCSGFAKWIIDGIVRPRAGNGLFIESLKASTASPVTHFTEPYRETRDIFFALDWTRNLASAVVSLDVGHTVKPDFSGVDVTVEPFSGVPFYEKNVGYPAASLAPLLYYLAVTEPGHFYLGAVSRERGKPLLRQYHHVAVFFPYFDASGKFAIAVFESAEETSMQSFIARNGDAFVNLVRVRVPEKGYFEP